MKAYQKCATIEEIALVSQLSQYVEGWQRNEEEPNNADAWSYRHYGPGEMVHFASIGVHVAIEEFYRGLDFEQGEDEEE